MSTRRDASMALTLLCASPYVCARSPGAGQVKRIAILGGESASEMVGFESPFLAAMRDKGWNVSENLVVERAYADGIAGRLPELARGLVRDGCDVIVTGGAQTTLAAARATRTIPIVFGGALWPVEQGLIDSLGRPGRNVTGHAFYAGMEYSTKRVQFLREIAPSATRLSWVWPEFLFSAETMDGGRVDLHALFVAAARRQGFETRFHLTSRGQSIDSVFEEAAAWGAQAVTAAGINEGPKRAADLAMRYRLPTIFDTRDCVEAGGLLSYGPQETSAASLASRTADYVSRILHGAKPAELPVEEPSRYLLAINTKTARTLGLTIPHSLLLRADEVID